MPPKTTPKPRSSAAPRPKPKTKPKPAPKRSPKTEPKSPPRSASPSPPPVLLDKALVLRILLAKLEASKTCDWYELSLKLGAESPEDTPKGKKGKGKKGVGTKDNARGLSGSDLHSLYHNNILPGLKAGRALWADDDDGLMPPLQEIDGEGARNSRPKAAKRHSSSSVEEVDEDISEEEMDVEPEPKAARPAKKTVSKRLEPVEEECEDEGGDSRNDDDEYWENDMSDVEYDDSPYYSERLCD